MAPFLCLEICVRNDVEYFSLISSLADLAHESLPLYGLASDLRVDLLSHSENTVFRITDDASGWRAAMRIHRPNYQTREAIQSELDWMTALSGAGIGTPRAIAGVDGGHLQQLTHPCVGERMVALFAWIDGGPPDESDLEPSMHRLGRLSARMHAHSREWSRPLYFERPAWDCDDTIGEHARWGRWRDAPGLTRTDINALAHTEQLIRARLDAYGRGPDRFGLIHADLRIANLLVSGARTNIIDFDDCGIGWFLHDMASALSFIEHRPDLPRLMDAWAVGYGEIATLSATDVAEFPTFVMQRRLQLLAWMASHAETDLARSLGSEWVTLTAALGRDYLRKMT